MKLTLLVAACLLGATMAFVPSLMVSRTTHLYGKLDPLATEGKWSAYLDQDNTGMVYYFNDETGESLWEPPTDTFPTVTMDKEQRELARAKRSEYLATTTVEKEQPKKKGLLSAILKQNEKEEEAVVVEEETVQEKKAESNWFDGLFDKKPEEPKSSSVEPKVEPATKPVKEIEPKAEPVVKSDKEKAFEKEEGFFSSLFKGGKKKDTTTTIAVNGDRDQALFEVAKPQKVDKIETTERTEPIKVEIASVVLPHPAKVSWGGEDAVFVKGRSFGVFDGVSGADKLDGIPLFSVTLAEEMKRLLDGGGTTIKEIIKNLGDAADFANRAATGASTAVVGTVGEDGFLRVLNIGDSACLVVRNNKIATRTKEIVHYFDCPYQLSEDSPDRAQDGTRLNFEVMPGDVVVMGSDGVFDNLTDDAICDAIASAPARSSVIARRIADLSRKVSLDDNAATPYAKLAKRNGFEDFQTGLGGKVDDVSCVVVRCI